MKHTTIRTIVIGAALLIASTTFCQKEKKLKITFEDVKHKCDSLPLKERPRVSVTRFDVTTTNTPPELGANMATMLENALLETQCLRVLESLDNSSDMTKELDMANSEYANAASVGKKGKMLGAQAVVTGEITEYNEGDNTVGVAFVKTNAKKVRLGFILKVLDPQTRDIIWNKSVNVEGKSGGGASFGFGLPFVGRLNLASSVKNNPALANALENGVLESCSMLADNINSIPWPEAMDPDLKLTKITVLGTTYSEMGAFETLVKGASGVSKTTKGFSGGTGTVETYHKGSTDDLMGALDPTVSGKYNVETVEEGKIVLRKK